MNKMIIHFMNSRVDVEKNKLRIKLFTNICKQRNEFFNGKEEKQEILPIPLFTTDRQLIK